MARSSRSLYRLCLNRNSSNLHRNVHDTWWAHTGRGARGAGSVVNFSTCEVQKQGGMRARGRDSQRLRVGAEARQAEE